MGATALHAAPSRDEATARALGRRRRLKDAAIRIACLGATALGLLFLLSILFTLLWRGLPSLDALIFTRAFEPPTYGDYPLPRGGLRTATPGNLMQTDATPPHRHTRGLLTVLSTH